MLTDRQLQGMRNIGNESEEAANEIVALRAELDAMRKDAERYRWLRDSAVAEIYLPTFKNASGWAVLLGWQSDTERDAAVDAARGKP